MSFVFWLTLHGLQDPSNPKPKKRKERADDKVALTEKALAKARAEKEKGAKRTKTDISVEVNSPRMESGEDDNRISLHASDFIPTGSLGYTPASPTPSQADRTVAEVLPFTQMSKADKNKRVNEAMDIICTQPDRDHINEVNGKNEKNELYRSWLDISICMLFTPYTPVANSFSLCSSPSE